MSIAFWKAKRHESKSRKRIYAELSMHFIEAFSLHGCNSLWVVDSDVSKIKA